jgi:PKD repeat protein
MKRIAAVAVLFGMSLATSEAATRYVAVSNAAAASPYTNWPTAAATMQAALDVALPGDEVLVSNGVYAVGSRTVGEQVRVVVSNAVTLRSVNGAEATAIVGSTNPLTRCVYLAAGAVLDGFTVQGGKSHYPGCGVFCATTSARVVNCVITGNSSWVEGGGVSGGTIVNCEIVGNTTVAKGGGAVSAVLSNCLVTGNWARYGGGGVASSYAVGCRIVGNTVDAEGGGANDSTLVNCLVAGNAGDFWSYSKGGGLSGGTSWYCRIEGNRALDGGGAYAASLYSSVLVDNWSSGGGLGALACSLNNCTVMEHKTFPGYTIIASLGRCIVDNCIVYFNQVNYDGESVIRYTCTTPLAPGPGNIADDPRIVSLSNPRLLPGSPCINIGQDANWMLGAEDWEGESRLVGTVDMGADEFLEAGLTGKLSVAASAAPDHVGSGYAIDFVGAVSGKVQGIRWDFRDGNTTQDFAAVRYAYSSDGLRDVLLTASNLSGSATATVSVDVISFFHAAPGGSHQAPFTTWAHAATTIQAAVDAAYTGSVVLVSNGVYSTGGRTMPGSLLTNRLVVDRPLPVIGVGGPAVTVIEGSLDPFDPSGLGNSAARCVYLANGAFLSGFTLRNGRTRSLYDPYPDPVPELSGGGVMCAGPGAVVSNCWAVDNRAEGWGGGVRAGFVVDSRLASNRAQDGGGAYQAGLASCLVESNYATRGGGMYGGSGVNLRVTGNYSETHGGGTHDSEIWRSRMEGNTALNNGGGSYRGSLFSTLLASNIASFGGGACSSILYACTAIGNQAVAQGGGVSGGAAESSIIYFNSAPLGQNHAGASMTWCDSVPLPNGSGNIGVDPQLSPTGDPVLLSSSPCRDAGQNRNWMFGTADLAGNPRIAAGRVDMGAFEFAAADSDGDGLGDDWEMRHFGDLNSASATSDVDGDRSTDGSEYRAGTQPTNPASRFEALLPVPTSVTGSARTVYWSSTPGRTYRVERATNLLAAAPFSVLAAGQVATPAINTFVDSPVPTNTPLFYRVMLEP